MVRMVNRMTRRMATMVAASVNPPFTVEVSSSGPTDKSPWDSTAPQSRSSSPRRGRRDLPGPVDVGHICLATHYLLAIALDSSDRDGRTD